MVMKMIEIEPIKEAKVIRMGFAFNAVRTDVANLRGVHIDDKCDRITPEEIVTEMRKSLNFKPGEPMRFLVVELPVVYEIEDEVKT